MRSKRILIICGCLESGKDGVGDYSRKLAKSLINLGFDVNLLALFDSGITTSLYQIQEYNGKTVKTYRLPKIEDIRSNIILAKNYVDDFNPEFISLQYVPYSFSNKGLPINFVNHIKNLAKDKKWHIMFHELWCSPKSLKKFGISFLQHLIIFILNYRIKPILVTTHIPLYQTRLKMFGIRANPLPLFSNFEQIISKPDSGDIFRIGFFSQFLIEKSIIAFLNELIPKLVAKYSIVEIVLIGGGNNSAKSLLRILKSFENNVLRVWHTGFLSDYEIVTHLNSCDMGITSVPRVVLGKSGSVAAFLSQGVPVAAPHDIASNTGGTMSFFNTKIAGTIITTPDLAAILKAKKELIFLSDCFDVDRIAKQFIHQLEKSTK